MFLLKFDYNLLIQIAITHWMEVAPRCVRCDLFSYILFSRRAAIQFKSKESRKTEEKSEKRFKLKERKGGKPSPLRNTRHAKRNNKVRGLLASE